jgi:hypothetical protein
MDPGRIMLANPPPIANQHPPSSSPTNGAHGSVLVPVDYYKRPIIIAPKNMIPIDLSDLRSRYASLGVRSISRYR